MTEPRRARKGRPPNSQRRTRLPLATLGKGYARLARDVQVLRLLLERAVERRRGVVSEIDAVAISTACRCERGSRLAEWSLRTDATLASNPERRDAIIDRTIRYSAARDRAIDRLKLDDDGLGLPIPVGGGGSDPDRALPAGGSTPPPISEPPPRNDDPDASGDADPEDDPEDLE